MISVVLSVDSRPVNPSFEGIGKGARSRDFIGKWNLINKREFFKGHPIELIVHCDIHEPLTHEELDVLHEYSDCLILRKHTKHYRDSDPCNSFNDISFLTSLAMARGSHLVHVDGDMAMYSADSGGVQWMLDEVNSGRHRVVSYQSVNHPAPCHAPEYEGRWWASTRFFLTKREEFKFDVLERAIRENGWFYAEYGTPPRINPWFESFFGQLVNHSVLYPEPNLNSWAAFPWQTYVDGKLEELQNLPFGEVIEPDSESRSTRGILRWS